MKRRGEGEMKQLADYRDPFLYIEDGHIYIVEFLDLLDAMLDEFLQDMEDGEEG